MYPAKKAYLNRPKQERNLNLDTRDIKGTAGLNFTDRLDNKMQRAKSPIESSNRFAPYKPSVPSDQKSFPNQNVNLLVSQPLLSQKSIDRSPVRSPTPQKNNEQKSRPVSTRSNNDARSLTPEYKYIGQREVKHFTSKPDLRYNVRDINDKKSRWSKLEPPAQAFDVHREQKYRELQNLHKYERGLKEQPIFQEIVYKDGHRVDSKHIPRANSTNAIDHYVIPNRSDYDFANSRLKQMDQTKNLMQYEAKFHLNDTPKIMRDYDLPYGARTAHLTKSPGKRGF